MCIPHFLCPHSLQHQVPCGQGGLPLTPGFACSQTVGPGLFLPEKGKHSGESSRESRPCGKNGSLQSPEPPPQHGPRGWGESLLERGGEGGRLPPKIQDASDI